MGTEHPPHAVWPSTSMVGCTGVDVTETQLAGQSCGMRPALALRPACGVCSIGKSGTEEQLPAAAATVKWPRWHDDRQYAGADGDAVPGIGDGRGQPPAGCDAGYRRTYHRVAFRGTAQISQWLRGQRNRVPPWSEVTVTHRLV